MKGRQFFRTLIILFVFTSLQFSCTPFSPSTGRVRLVLGSGVGRTILPVVSVASYLISFSGPVARSSESTTQPDATIELEVGTWDISVEGRDSGGKTVAVGGASGVVVTQGATTAVSIMLSAQSSGTGAIDVTVMWPVTVNPSVDTVGVTLDGSSVPGGAVTFTPGGTSVRYMEGKAAGNYRLIINLNSGGSLRASVQEAVQVYGNLASSAAIVLLDADFTSPPAAPSGLVVAEGLGKLDLSWADNSHVETGYVLERSTGDNQHFGILDGGLPADAMSYSDTTAAMGQTYWYRVMAKNALGDSGYSNETSGKVEAPVPGGSGVLTFSVVTSNSIQVSWQKATDNVSAQSALVYKVVRSLSDNVRTVEEAQANGIVVQDWTLDIATVDATGLSAGTLYYFGVLVKDGVGNVNVYASSSTMTSIGVGSLQVTITVTSPQNQTITFDREDNIVMAPDAVLHITIGEGFASYEWVLDGLELSAQTSATVNIDCTSLSLGVHHVSAFVTRQGKLYSKTLPFRIEN